MADEDLTIEDLNAMRVVDLKKECDKRRLSKSGTKKQLIERLRVVLDVEKAKASMPQQEEGEAPPIDEVAMDNDVIKEYMAKRQEMFAQQKQAKRRWEEQQADSELSQDEDKTETSESAKDDEEPETKRLKVSPEREKSPSPAKDSPRRSRRSRRTSEKGDGEPAAVSPRRSQRQRQKSDPVSDDSETRMENGEGSEDSRRIVVAKEPSSEPEREESPAKEREDPAQKDSPPRETPSDRTKGRSRSPSSERDKSPSRERSEELQADSTERRVVKERTPPGDTRDRSSSSERDDSPAPVQVSAKAPEERVSRSPTPDRRVRRRTPTPEKRVGSRSRSSSRSHRSRSSSASSCSEDAQPHIRRSVVTASQDVADKKAEPENESGHAAKEEKSPPEDIKDDEEPMETAESTRKEDAREEGKDEETEEKDESKLNKSLSRQGSEGNGERPVKRRKWGSTRAVNKKTSVNISTQSLKGIVPDIKLDKLDALGPEPVLGVNGQKEARGADSPDEAGSVSSAEPEGITAAGGMDVDDDSRDTSSEVAPAQKDKESVRTVVKKADAADPHDEDVVTGDIEEDSEDEHVDAEKDAKEKRKVVEKPSAGAASARPARLGIAADEPTARRRSASPPRNPESNIVHVRNLVRPYTLGQLKELLKRTGTVTDEGFWIDKIKSHCYAIYENMEQAKETRKALHGTRWPTSNPKVLRVDFASQDEFDRHKAGDFPVAFSKKKTAEEVREEETKKRAEEREKREKERKARQEERDKEREKRRQDVRERDRERARKEHVREWDKDKVRQSKSPSPGRQRSRDDKERRRPSGDRRDRGLDREKERDREHRRSRDRRTSSRPKDKKAEEEEPPAKLLDDLFCKTKAMPCIYWLPLTEEQIAARAQEEQKKEAERLERRKKIEDERKNKDKEEEERRRQRETERKSGSARRSRSREREDRDRRRR